LVTRHAIGQVLDVAAAADLLAFETPAFHDRLARAQINGASRPLQMTTGLVSVVQGIFGIAGVGAALLFIQPLFLVLLVAAYIPVWFADNQGEQGLLQALCRAHPDGQLWESQHVDTFGAPGFYPPL
jgi:hypothetical protein